MQVIARKGDSFWYYSQLFGVPLVLIEESNLKSKADNLIIGSEVAIPGFQMKRYNVMSGDSFWSIAMKTKMPIDALILLNQNHNPSVLQVGETLNIPIRVTTRMVDPQKKYDSNELSRDIQSLFRVYPFLKRSIIGQSVLKKPLCHIELGKGKKKVHWNGSFHANEWITTSVIMTFLNDYLIAITTNETLRGIPLVPIYEQVTLSLVPMVNPDGVDLVLNGVPAKEKYKCSVLEMNQNSHDFTGWKANIRGVDLNNQYPACWQIEKDRKVPKSPAPRDYPGDAPLTEPEAIAMAELTLQENFDMVVAFHTQGEEFYWGYEGCEPEESAKMAAEFARVSLYKSVRYVDSHAGYKDWFIQEFKKPGFTLELGKGINPLPLSQFDQIYQKVFGICLASLYL
ncbi:M14 family metallopeptidase [Sutcliffiella halmapala]|uniref:M14 family metallopeptidase n=1 Tax=Sutcliffiella halmapala TaxID=79882 RepID=UPI0009956DD8|nr:M14 family metallopeptidase [Sutcliffiella halmapala]